MKTKTWNIGESSYYGTWNIKISKSNITVTGLMYKTKDIKQINVFDITDLDSLQDLLYDVSTVYHGDKMMEWVRANI